MTVEGAWVLQAKPKTIFCWVLSGINLSLLFDACPVAHFGVSSLWLWLLIHVKSSVLDIGTKFIPPHKWPTGSRLIPKWPIPSSMSSCLKKKIKRFLSARDLVYHQLLAKYVANKNSGMPKLQAFWSVDDDGDNAKIPKIGRDNASNQGGTTQTAQ